MRYYALSDTPDVKTVDADEKWLEAVRPKLFPRGCKHLTPDSAFDEVTVAKTPPPWSWISPIRVRVAQNDLLLDMFGPGAMDAIKAAPVKVRHGASQERYLAFEPQRRILVRGQSMSTLKGACEKCGHLYYWPQPTREPEKWYLV